MSKLKKYSFLFSIILTISLILVSCNNKDSSNGTSHLKISMTDAPGDYDEVNIEVLDVKIKNSNGTDENGWVSIGNINPGIYNLLDLTGGITQVLADNEVPSGYLGQIRLILGTNNTVVKNGITYPLKTPSAQQSGLKLKIKQTLLPDIDYAFLIDFDVKHSIVVQAGNSGNYNLHPVLRVTSQAISGSIKGKVEAQGFQVLASVIVNGVEVSAYTDDSGVFYLHGIPSGTYTITLTPEISSGLATLEVGNVEVINGIVTDIGILTL